MPNVDDLSCGVVIVCHNYGRFLADAIESVLAQSLPATELLVVLDHCSDESHAVAKRSPVETLETDACDPHLARRLGVRSTRSEILVFLDADDRLSPNYLEDGLAAFHDPGVGIVSGDIQRFGTDNCFISAGSGDVELQNCVTSAALVRRTAIDASGCFEDFSLVGVASEDWETWKRIVRAGWRIANPAVPITHFHRRHGGNRTLSRLYHEDATSQAERRLVPDPGRTLRIGYVSPSAGMGGAETQIVAQIRHARRLDWVAAWVPEEAPRNAEILARLPPLEAGDEGLARLCRSVEAVYVWGLPHKVAAIRQFTSAPILYGVHGEGEWTRNAVAQIATEVDVLVCVSHGAVRTVPPRQRHKVRLIRGGAGLGAVVATRQRHDVRRDWGIVDGELAVGYAGRLSAEKNPVVIARAVALIPNARLIVCSPQAGGEKHPLRREIAAALGDRVVWTSSAMQPMGAVYRGLDCLVVASHEEGMPTVTLEAWAAGLAVVSTPVGLIQELEPRHGPLVERVPLDPTPEALANAIVTSSRSNFSRTETARELVLNRLSMQRMTVAFEEMAQQIVETSERSGQRPRAAPVPSRRTLGGHGGGVRRLRQPT